MLWTDGRKGLAGCALHLMRALRLMRALSLMLAACGTPRALAQDSTTHERVRVSMVRILDGDLVYEWREGALPPGREDFSKDGTDADAALRAEARAATDPRAVYSFLDFRPGSSMESAALESSCALARRRLEATGWFYTASVFTAPPLLHPESRTVVIELSEGFRPRFGGGAYYASLGEEDWQGRGLSYSLTAGLNAAAASLGSASTGALPLFWSAGISYSNGLGSGLSGPDFHSGRLDARIGYRLPADLSVSIFGAARASRIYDDPAARIYAAPLDEFAASGGPSLSYLGQIGDGPGPSLKLAVRARAFILSEFLSGSLRFGTDGSLTLTPAWGPLSLLVRAAGAWANGELPALDRCDLGSGTDIRLRASFGSEDLRTEDYGFAGAELRFPLAAWMLPPAISLSLGGFLFADQALLRRPSETQARFRAAYGLGLRAAFANPVFTAFSLSWGISNQDIAAENFPGLRGLRFAAESL